MEAWEHIAPELPPGWSVENSGDMDYQQNWRGAKMPRRSTALTIIEDPYREAPAERPWTSQRELSVCKWCRFSSWSKCWHPAMQTRGCAGRYIETNIKYPSGCERWKAARDGLCASYDPTILTRLLRKVGLRKAVMR